MTADDFPLAQHNLDVPPVARRLLHLLLLSDLRADNRPAIERRLAFTQPGHSRFGNSKHVCAVFLRLHARYPTRSHTQTSVYRGNITLQRLNHFCRDQPARYYFNKTLTRLAQLAHVIIAKTAVIKLRHLDLSFLEVALRLPSGCRSLRSRRPSRRIPRRAPLSSLLRPYCRAKLLYCARKSRTLLIGKSFIIANLLQPSLSILQIILLDQFIRRAERLVNTPTFQRPTLRLLDKLKQLLLGRRREVLLVALRHQELLLGFSI